MTIRGPFGFVAEVAPGADPSDSPSTWNFTSEGVRWRQRSGITTSVGRDDESSEVEAGSLDITLDARDGRLSPRNVLGPWYGQIGTNTPIRLMLPVVNDAFDRTTSAGSLGTEPLSGFGYTLGNASYWSISGSAARAAIPTANNVATAVLSRPVGNEVDITHTASISAVPTGANFVHATVVRRVDSTNYYRLHTEFQTDGTIAVKITRVRAGSSTDLGAFTPTGVAFSAGTAVKTRVRTIGRALQIRVWTGSTEPDAWNLVAYDDQVDGGVAGFYEWRVNGNTNVGTLTVAVTEWAVRSSVYTGQVPEWRVRWPSKSGADCVTPVSASGILRWLNQGQPPLEAPVAQQLSSYNPQAYWKLDEGSEAKTAGDSVAFGFPATAQDVTFGSEDAPPGATASAIINTMATSRLSGTVRSWNLGNGDGAAMCFVRFPSLPAVGGARALMEVRTVGDIRRWIVSCDNNSITFTGYDADGDPVVTPGSFAYAMDPTSWWSLQIEMRKSGTSNTEWALIWNQVGSPIFFSVSGTASGRLVSRITAVDMTAPVDGVLVSNLWVGPETLPYVDTTFLMVSSGFRGETDVDRIRRVLGYIGIECFIAPGAGRRLGPQPRNATVLDVVRDAELAGLGLLYERGAALGYLPWSARANVPVALALDWSLGHLDEAPEPTDDDARLVNRFTSSRPNGGSRTAENAASIARRRVYPSSETVGVERDEQLADDAGWRVAVGTVDSLRWPRVKINLSRNPDLIPAWLACHIGSRVTIANLPDQVAGEVADLIIEGYAMEIDTDYEWTVELSCTPAEPWTQVGIWGESRGDSASAELASPVNSSATAWPVRALVYEDTWAAAGGYSVKAAGEVLPVTSATTPVLSGGYWTQTLNVTRGSALAKAHAAGEAIRLAEPKRWGMGY